MEHDCVCLCRFFIVTILYFCTYINIFIYLTTMGFPIKNDLFVVFWGYHHLRKHPYRYIYVTCRECNKNAICIFYILVRINIGPYLNSLLKSMRTEDLKDLSTFVSLDVLLGLCGRHCHSLRAHAVTQTGLCDAILSTHTQ